MQHMLRGRPRSSADRRGSLPSLVAATLGPALLTGLPRREQEIATIVYLRGEATAREVEQALSDRLTNSAVRSMLTRLVRKRVLRRRRDGKKYHYLPALCDAPVREAALGRVARDYFDGSLYRTALGLLDMLDRQQPGSLDGLVRSLRFDHRGALSDPRAAVGS